ncbi:MAG TPA: GNAT family acetyltransferase [Miltoncostaeales bacterium]|jgi:RimJ/RimL family protein N-acetyltransferase|nr:GNAT family acetyltransferase [Miltoncostaeales bacterium]
MPTLTTGRLELRPFVAADLDAYARICADSEVMRFIGEGGPISREQAWRQLAMFAGQWSLDGYGMWAVIERATSKLVGRVGAWHPDGWPGLELGWLLGREHWGLGYATEAAGAARDFLFDEVGVPTLISLIDPANVRSIAVAQRLGETEREPIALLGRQLLVFGVDAPERAGLVVHAVRDGDASHVVALWRQTDLTRPWNDPHSDLETACDGRASEVLVAVEDSTIVGTVMVGHDGHRGWVYYLAVDPAHNRGGVGRVLMQAAEHWVRRRGIKKMNLMVREGNRGALGFYAALRYQVQDVVTLGRWLTEDGEQIG